MPRSLASSTISVIGLFADAVLGGAAAAFLRGLLAAALVISVSLASPLHRVAVGQTSVKFVESGAGLTGVSVGSTSITDVDGDGNQDLLVTGQDENDNFTTTLYLGDGQGGFTEADAGLTQVAGVFFPNSTSIADVNGDGNQDLLITGSAGINNPTSILYLGDGRGGFEEAGAGLTGVSAGTSTSIADVDEDGNLDVLITGLDTSDTARATLYLGDGQGGFTEADAGLTGVLDSSSSIADVDGDGNQDLLITGSAGLGNPTATLYLGDGQGDFSESGVGLTRVAFSSTSIADVDGDKNQDLLVAGQDANGNPTATLYLGDGQGGFTEANAGLVGVSNGSVEIGDLGGDSIRDLLLTGGSMDGVTATLYLGRPGQTQVSVSQTFGGDQERDYELVALPGQADGTLSETVAGDWRGFREQGASGGQAYDRTECSGGCQFGPGKGFWLIAGEAWSVDRTVETVDLSGEGTVQIGLEDGWNVVSNPLETDVSWSAVQQATGTSQPLWEFSGSWNKASTFESAKAGTAYYFRDDQISALTVPYPGAGGSSAQGKPQAKADTAQVEEGARRALTLSVASGGEAVTSVRAGVRPEAKEGLDRFDHYGPPGYFGPATLRLMQHRNSGEEGEERPVALATEYRGPGGDGHAFDLRLRAAADTALTLRAGGLGGFSGEKVSLVETATGEAHALQEGEEITILQRTAEARYRLLVGSAAYVEAKTEDLRPSEVKLLPNYPNPFSRQTTIEYALPEARAVRLAVYDVLGRQVAVLQEGRQDGGFHQVRWDTGAGLSSGSYFLRLKAGNTTETQRLTIVR